MQHHAARKQRKHMYDTKSVQTTTTSEPRSLRLAEQPMSMCGQAGIAHPMRCRDEQQKKGHETSSDSKSKSQLRDCKPCNQVCPQCRNKGQVRRAWMKLRNKAVPSAPDARSGKSWASNFTSTMFILLKLDLRAYSSRMHPSLSSRNGTAK